MELKSEQDGSRPCVDPPAECAPSRLSLDGWVGQLLADDEMLRMGHSQRREDQNLGMGWLYYALTRLIRPSRVVVIGFATTVRMLVLSLTGSLRAPGGGLRTT